MAKAKIIYGCSGCGVQVQMPAEMEAAEVPFARLAEFAQDNSRNSR